MENPPRTLTTVYSMLLVSLIKPSLWLFIRSEEEDPIPTHLAAVLCGEHERLVRCGAGAGAVQLISLVKTVHCPARQLLLPSSSF